MIRLIAFLGNPGKQYRNTRHNAGFLLADKLTQSYSLGWSQQFDGQSCRFPLLSPSRYGLQPSVFMNLSGQSIQKAMAYYKLAPQELLVCHDDLETPEGEIKLKNGGGLGGHNGLRSVAQVLGTKDFQRLALGIGRPPKGSVSSYVLGNFSPDEKISLELAMEKALIIFKTQVLV